MPCGINREKGTLTTDFHRLLALLGRADEGNIRFVRGETSYVHGFRGNVENALDIINSANEAPAHLWYEYNESRFSNPKGRSSESDISRVTALIADIDFKDQPGGMGSLQGSLELIRDLTGAIGVPPGAIVHSGNGLQAYWALTGGEATVGNTANLAAMLRRWGSFVKIKAAALGGSADSVFDLPRILRVPGSYNIKDSALPKRVTVEFSDYAEPLTVEEVNAILDDHDVPLVEPENYGEAISAMSEWEWADHDCRFVHTALEEINESLPAARHPWALKYAAIIHGMIRSGCVTEESFYRLRDALAERLKWLCANTEPKRVVTNYEITSTLNWGRQTAESWTNPKLGEEMRQHLHDDFIALMPSIANPSVAVAEAAAQPSATPPATTQPVEIKQKDANERLRQGRYTDTGNSEALAQTLRGKYIWVPGLGWHVWADGRYVLDTANTILEEAKSLMTSNLIMATTEAAANWAKQSLGRQKLTNMIELCKSIPYLVVDTIRLDANPLELVTPGGIVDLATSQIRPADPSRDFNTMTTGTIPTFGVRPVQFLRFLEWALPDYATRKYMQRLLGIALIGEVRWHILPICLGVGSNGKTTLMDIASGTLGTYAATMPQRYLVEKNGSSHPTEIAQLRGIRLAIASEVPPTARFDEALVKSITGETKLRGRYMGENYFDFPNSVTMFLLANHLPTVTVGGSGFWRRIRKIDFRNKVKAGDENETLVQQILALEAGAILAWMIEGAADVMANGIQDPAEVLASTREYQMEEDTMARFTDENLIAISSSQVSRDLVYTRYQSWCYRQNMNPMPFIKFSREIATIFPDAISGAPNVYAGVNILSYALPTEANPEPGTVFYGSL